MKECVSKRVVSHQYEAPTVHVVKFSSESLFCMSKVETNPIDPWTPGEKDPIFM